MKQKRLAPKRVIMAASSEYLHEKVMEIYSVAHMNGCEHIVPPSVVMYWDSLVGSLFSNQGAQGFIAFDNEYRGRLEALYDQGADYFLIGDANSSVATALYETSLHATILEKEKDMRAVRKMIRQGKLFSWDVQGKSLEEIGDNLKEKLWRNKRRIMTVDEFVKNHYRE